MSPPAVSVSCTVAAYGYVTFTVTVDDEPGGSGINSVSLYVDEVLEKTWSTAGTHNYTSGPYSEGDHSYYVSAIDQAGNSADTETKSFNLSWSLDATSTPPSTATPTPTEPSPPTPAFSEWIVTAIIVAVVAAAATVLLLLKKRQEKIHSLKKKL